MSPTSRILIWINVYQAVSFRSDQLDDTLDVNGTMFIGLTGGVLKGGVANDSTFVITIRGNSGTDPSITGGSVREELQLDYIHNCIAVGDQNINVTLPDGFYEVQLLLADGFIGGFGIDRIADILVEGVLTDDFSYLDEQVVDINGVVLTELVHLTDGNLDISLTQDGGNGGPHISGFIVSQAVDLCALVTRPDSAGRLFRRRRASRGLATTFIINRR